MPLGRSGGAGLQAPGCGDSGAWIPVCRPHSQGLWGLSLPGSWWRWRKHVLGKSRDSREWTASPHCPSGRTKILTLRGGWGWYTDDLAEVTGPPVNQSSGSEGSLVRREEAEVTCLLVPIGQPPRARWSLYPVDTEETPHGGTAVELAPWKFAKCWARTLCALCGVGAPLLPALDGRGHRSSVTSCGSRGLSEVTL